MWTYILRRLLLIIPTLLGVTIVSFCIMQLAPGDPLSHQLSSRGLTGESTETRDSYLIRKRDLKLDKPPLLNFRYFQDYSRQVRAAAHYLGRSEAEIIAELPDLSAGAGDPAVAARLKFLRSLPISDFQDRLQDSKQHKRLASAIVYAIRMFCEDSGDYGVPAAIQLLGGRARLLPSRGRKLKIGAIRCLDLMTVEPFQYTYSRRPTDEETPRVVAVWTAWWKRAAPTFPELDPDRSKIVARQFAELAGEPSRSKQMELIEQFYREDMRYFIEKLLGDGSLQEKAIAAAALKLYVSRPLQLTVPLEADERLIDKVSRNWLLFFDLRRAEYQPGFLKKLCYILGDTQYAHMAWKLVTFQFGRSAVKTREPVGRKIWDAVLVSAPLMILAQLLIYFVAVPLGIVCAVNRSNWIDRLISLKLFLLYSIPPFVAGMLFLLFFCYGDHFKWFPSLGLHSEGAQDFGWLRYMLDYLWHIILPVVCLSLFSLAGMAMYSRTSMLDVIGQDYIRTARAKGLSERKVILKHGFRNALIPIITLFASFLPAMLGGSVLIEYLFGIPGMGRLSWESIKAKDYPTLLSLLYVDAIVVMISILLTDILYVFVDPRIGFESQEKSA